MSSSSYNVDLEPLPGLLPAPPQALPRGWSLLLSPSTVECQVLGEAQLAFLIQMQPAGQTGISTLGTFSLKAKGFPDLLSLQVQKARPSPLIHDEQQNGQMLKQGLKGSSISTKAGSRRCGEGGSQPGDGCHCLLLLPCLGFLLTTGPLTLGPSEAVICVSSGLEGCLHFSKMRGLSGLLVNSERVDLNSSKCGVLWLMKPCLSSVFDC